jgi:hypothetical protein
MALRPWGDWPLGEKPETRGKQNVLKRNEMTSPNLQDKNEKIIRMVDYLAQVANLLSKLTRRIGDYDKSIWVSSIPKEQGCFTQAWGRDAEHELDEWLVVQKRREPEFPPVPIACEDWVDRSSLRGKNGNPALISEIIQKIQNPKWRKGSDQPKIIQRTERILDHPDVQQVWDRYVEEKWAPWREKCILWEAVHKAYNALFAIRQEQQRLGEEYELVLGLGLLTWRTPSDQLVQRHLIVADAMLDFEESLGKITVRPHTDGANLRPELDMLDIVEKPDGAEKTAKKLLAGAADDPWEKGCVEDALKALAHSISSLGEYVGSLEAIQIDPSAKPIVEYAPALILRKRSAKGLAKLCRRD